LGNRIEEIIEYKKKREQKEDIKYLEKALKHLMQAYIQLGYAKRKLIKK